MGASDYLGRVGYNWSRWLKALGLAEHIASTDLCWVFVSTLQVALISEVARARAALDAHAGVAGVVEAWLRFLWNLAAEKANRVRCRLWGGW